MATFRPFGWGLYTLAGLYTLVAAFGLGLYTLVAALQWANHFWATLHFDVPCADTPTRGLSEISTRNQDDETD